MHAGRASEAGRAGEGAAHGVRLVLRHQLGALVTTALDFCTMIAAVELLHLRPSHATMLGAFVGAVFNYTLGRHWIFDRRETLATPKRWQALRYALVSGASLALNALGVRLLAEVLGLQFVVARTIVAISVSLGWNYPMHRRFVYAAAPARAPRPEPLPPSAVDRRFHLGRSTP